MTIKIELFPEINTRPEEILNHELARDLKLRICNTLSGSSLICIVMKETEDSFLVALPCKLMAYGEKKTIEPYMPVRFFRLFKTSLIGMMPIFGEFEGFYIRWLLENGNALFGEVIDDLFVTKLKQRFEEIKDNVTKYITSLESIADKKEENKEEELPIPVPKSSYRH